MSSWANRVAQSATTSGTGTFSLSASAESGGYQAIPAALDGATVQYAAVYSDGNQWEVGSGVYTHSGRTLTRTVEDGSSGAGVAVNFGSAPIVFIDAPASVAALIETAVQPPASDGNYYAYKDGAWVNITNKIIDP